ncbi:hypothetical protein KVT40_005445 [Elsinoe batatas]|uniref:Uncharacterized protein n=1 Tax=Elsinoe batatas TaxID=2601811 RepID=A0A8K0L318_9PEZI|nr:hypothetical protein KVT40_005445 [Elsinoe batatas]
MVSPCLWLGCYELLACCKSSQTASKQSGEDRGPRIYLPGQPQWSPCPAKQSQLHKHHGRPSHAIRKAHPILLKPPQDPSPPRHLLHYRASTFLPAHNPPVPLSHHPPPSAAGITNLSWTTSHAAATHAPASHPSMLSHPDLPLACRSTLQHVRNHCPHGPSNLVTWTCSLLYALGTIFHHFETQDGELEEIKLFIIDTHALPKGRLIRAVDLMSALNDLDRDPVAGLDDIHTFRSPMREAGGDTGWDQGTYVSLGALRVSGDCVCLTAQQLVRARVTHLCPDLVSGVAREEKLTMAETMRRLREVYSRPVAGIDGQGEDEFAFQLGRSVSAIRRVVESMEPKWRLPMLVNLLATIPVSSEWEGLGRLWRRVVRRWADDNLDFATLDGYVECIPDDMPEMEQLDFVIRNCTEWSRGSRGRSSRRSDVVIKRDSGTSLSRAALATIDAGHVTCVGKVKEVATRARCVDWLLQVEEAWVQASALMGGSMKDDPDAMDVCEEVVEEWEVEWEEEEVVVE